MCVCVKLMWHIKKIILYFWNNLRFSTRKMRRRTTCRSSGSRELYLTTPRTYLAVTTITSPFTPMVWSDRCYFSPLFQFKITCYVTVFKANHSQMSKRSRLKAWGSAFVFTRLSSKSSACANKKWLLVNVLLLLEIWLWKVRVTVLTLIRNRAMRMIRIKVSS